MEMKLLIIDMGNYKLEKLYVSSGCRRVIGEER